MKKEMKPGTAVAAKPSPAEAKKQPEAAAPPDGNSPADFIAELENMQREGTQEEPKLEVHPLQVGDYLTIGLNLWRMVCGTAYV